MVKGISSISHPYKGCELIELNNPTCSDSSIELFELLNKRKKLLTSYRKKQPFRVSKGKSHWLDYEKFDPSYNLREILNDEIVIEFDHDNQDLTWKAINLTAVNLCKANYEFEIWDHGGKSPHLHIHNLPCGNLSPNKRKLFKKIFIRTYVPKDFLERVDISLTGIHLVAIEHCFHWKGKYGYKKLINKWEKQP